MKVEHGIIRKEVYATLVGNPSVNISRSKLRRISSLVIFPIGSFSQYSVKLERDYLSVLYTYLVRPNLPVKFSFGFSIMETAPRIINSLNKQRRKFSESAHGASTGYGLRRFLYHSGLGLEFDRKLMEESYVITPEKSVAKKFTFELSGNELKTGQLEFEKYILDNAVIQNGYVVEDFGVVKAGVKILDLAHLCRELFRSLSQYGMASVHYRKATESYGVGFEIPLYDVQKVKEKNPIEELVREGNAFECAYLYVHTDYYPARMKYANNVISRTGIDETCDLIKENAITQTALKKRIRKQYFDYVASLKGKKVYA